MCIQAFICQLNQHFLHIAQELKGAGITIQIIESPPAACGVAGGRAEDVSSNSLGQTFA